MPPTGRSVKRTGASLHCRQRALLQCVWTQGRDYQSRRRQRPLVEDSHVLDPPLDTFSVSRRLSVKLLTALSRIYPMGLCGVAQQPTVTSAVSSSVPMVTRTLSPSTTSCVRSRPGPGAEADQDPQPVRSHSPCRPGPGLSPGLGSSPVHTLPLWTLCC